MAHGEISENNTRLSLVIPKELKSKLTAYAYKDYRSLNNLVVKVLTDYVTARTEVEPELTQSIKENK